MRPHCATHRRQAFALTCVAFAIVNRSFGPFVAWIASLEGHYSPSSRWLTSYQGQATTVASDSSDGSSRYLERKTQFGSFAFHASCLASSFFGVVVAAAVADAAFHLSSGHNQRIAWEVANS